MEMTAIATEPKPAHDPPATVRTCYDLLHVSLSGGIDDFTEGKFTDEQREQAASFLDEAVYAEAQQRQADYLLDQIDCGPGSRILDIGCGYGRVLRTAAGRGAAPVGVTISAQQAAYCRNLGLDAYEQNYLDIDCRWHGTFDGIVANGSLEHFAQATDALACRDGAIYEELFAICRRLLRPRRRFVTTAIHFKSPNQVRPEDIVKGPYAFPRGTPEYHFGMILERTFGGWFPYPGQLQKCSRGYFHLVREEDGTDDYHITSEYWLRRMRRSIALRPAVWYSLLRTFAKRPRATADMLRCLVWDQSWMWQFRSPAPTRLLRHTWEANG
jgi:cyclopropane fatty-acyl-phospholipid synthase-like methyltransferase